jgi:hypothetical protein
VRRCTACRKHKPLTAHHWRFRRSGTVVGACLDCLRVRRRLREAARRSRDPVGYLAKRAAQARKDRAARSA